MTMPECKFKTGDLVQFVTGPPLMLVVGIFLHPQTDTLMARCKYYSLATGEFKEETFNVNHLVK